MIAADHPARGALRAGERPLAMADRADLLERLVLALSRPGVNGVLGTPDVLEDLLLLGALDGKVVVGSMNRGGLAGTVFEMDDRFTGYDAAAIAAAGFEGGKMLTRIDPDDPTTVATLEACGHAVSDLAGARPHGDGRAVHLPPGRRARPQRAHRRSHDPRADGGGRARPHLGAHLAEGADRRGHGAGDGGHHAARADPRRRGGPRPGRHVRQLGQGARAADRAGPGDRPRRCSTRPATTSPRPWTPRWGCCEPTTSFGAGRRPRGRSPWSSRPRRPDGATARCGSWNSRRAGAPRSPPARTRPSCSRSRAAARWSATGRSSRSTGRRSVFSRVTDFAYVPRDAEVTVSSADGGRFALPAARATRRLRARATARPRACRSSCAAPGQASRQVNNFCMPATFEADKLIAVEVLTPGSATGRPSRRTSTTRTATASRCWRRSTTSRSTTDGAAATSASTPRARAARSTCAPRCAAATPCSSRTAGTARRWPPPATTSTTSTSWPGPATSGPGRSATTRRTPGSAAPGTDQEIDPRLPPHVRRRSDDA